MGYQDVKQAAPEELREFMRLLLRDVHALERMLDEGMVETGVRRIGAEQELFLVDDAFKPSNRALDVLAAIDDPHFTTELGQFNIEYNLDPVVFRDTCLRELDDQLKALLQQARAGAQSIGDDVVMTGILPTLQLDNLSLDWMTPMPRYYALNDALCREAGGKYKFQIKGTDEFRIDHDNVMLEACNTSFQVHFQVGPEEFARLYNVAQVNAAPVLAVATNSPLLFGKRLWHETRIALFQQSIDTRATSGHRSKLARVSFGSKWVDDGILDIVREDVTRFRLLLSTDHDGDPIAALDRGEVPSLKALRLHNGTVYRWNRACYGILDGKPHLRIENRVLPAGPTTLDEMANATFWFGLMSGVSEHYPDVRGAIDFDDARANFRGAARYGLGTSFKWLDGKTYPADDLVANHLVPMAREALKNRGIDATDVDHYLDVIEERTRSGMTGSRWQIESFQNIKTTRSAFERLSAVTAATIQRQGTGAPVHTWPLATVEEGPLWKHDVSKASHLMATDLFTVNEHELVDLVASVMDWQQVKHVPVEDENDRLVGLVTYRTMLRYLVRKGASDTPVPVSQIMTRNVITATPETDTLDIIKRMREHMLSCVPIVDADGKLVGMVTQEALLDVARDLLLEGLGS